MTISIGRKMLAGVVAGAVLLGLQVTLMAQTSRDAQFARYHQIQQQRLTEITSVPGVHGTAIGPSKSDPSRLVIFVYVKPGTRAEVAGKIPTQFDGAPVEIVEEEPAAPL